MARRRITAQRYCNRAPARSEHTSVPNSLTPDAGAPGTALPFRVPQVDADGNERSGIRLPEVHVPLATYTGWNVRDAASGDAGTIRPLTGPYIPFPTTTAERQASHDRPIDDRVSRMYVPASC